MASPSERMALVGRIARPHGNRGHVVVNPETDFPDERFEIGHVVHAQVAGAVQPLVVTEMRMYRGRVIVGFEGVASIEAAERFRNAELKVSVDDLRALPAGTYYRHDLTGCRVVTVEGQPIGEVSRVDGTLERSWLVIVRRAETDEGDGHQASVTDEVLVPLTEHICAQIDVNQRQIVIDPPDGLLELNGPASGGAPRMRPS